MLLEVVVAIGWDKKRGPEGNEGMQDVSENEIEG